MAVTSETVVSPTVITLEMIEARYATLRRIEEQDLDGRIKSTPALKARAAKLGGYPLPEHPLPVIMLDEIVHTLHTPVCAESVRGCCCYQCEREQMTAERDGKRAPARRRRIISAEIPTPPAGIDAPLNGNRPFSLLR